MRSKQEARDNPRYMDLWRDDKGREYQVDLIGGRITLSRSMSEYRAMLPKYFKRWTAKAVFVGGRDAT